MKHLSLVAAFLVAAGAGLLYATLRPADWVPSEWRLETCAASALLALVTLAVGVKLGRPGLSLLSWLPAALPYAGQDRLPSGLLAAAGLGLGLAAWVAAGEIAYQAVRGKGEARRAGALVVTANLTLAYGAIAGVLVRLASDAVLAWLGPALPVSLESAHLPSVALWLLPLPLLFAVAIGLGRPRAKMEPSPSTNPLPGSEPT